MGTKHIGQRKWVRSILDEFVGLQKHQIEPFNQDPELPEWVNQLLLQLVCISHPGVKFKNIKNWKAKDLGRLLGRQFAGEHLAHGHVPISPQVQAEGIKCAQWCEAWATQKLPGHDWKGLHQRNEIRDRRWQMIFRQFMQTSVASACARPYPEMRDFFEAFGKAVVMKPDEFLTDHTMGVGDKIAWAMIAMWREIERLKSVGELHRLFEKALMPHGIAVKYKRIEKLCQRIGLKFKDPGRPAGNSDKSA
jgi:hypothetical protein